MSVLGDPSSSSKLVCFVAMAACVVLLAGAIKTKKEGYHQLPYAAPGGGSMTDAEAKAQEKSDKKPILDLNKVGRLKSVTAIGGIDFRQAREDRLRVPYQTGRV
jgi:hypothetical protein